jgi:hypothetical protein
VASLRNGEIQWNGTFAGLVPSVEGPHARALVARGEPAIAALVAAIEDPQKFAAAHVVLTLIRKQPYPTSASQWNQLTVSVRSDGTADLHPEQIPEIKAFWQNLLSDG